MTQIGRIVTQKSLKCINIEPYQNLIRYYIQLILITILTIISKIPTYLVGF